MMEYFVVVFIYKMQQLEIGCVGNIIFFQKYYRQLKKKGSYIHIYRDYPGERCPGDTPQPGVRYLWVFECIQ